MKRHLKEKDVGKEQQSCAHEGCSPEEQAFTFNHPEVDQEEPQSVQGVEDEEEEEQHVNAPVFVKPWKPGEAGDLSCQGIPGKKL